jgi:hypothetical protein
MITINSQPRRVDVTVLGEFTLADYQEFENQVNGLLHLNQDLDLVVDLREMSGFTIDVALEDIKFSQAHRKDFSRIAIISESQGVSWTAWLTRSFVDAEVKVFDSVTEADAWLSC